MKQKNHPGNDPAMPLRVAAYIRVSTMRDEQEDSYELQERYFTGLLEKNPTWISAGVYSDYAVSATNADRRTGFKRLMRHCREGKINRIITKSISRFARNTSDFLSAIEKKDEDVCDMENICEIALQQSFMECIYAIRCDYLENGVDSWVCTHFKKVNGAKAKTGLMSYNKPGLKERFDLFLSSIVKLPEPATDFLNYDKELYQAFVEKGEIQGETVTYTTNFGVPIITSGNSRGLSDFVGKTRQLEDGTTQLMTEPWQVNGKKLAYVRKKRKRVKKDK